MNKKKDSLAFFPTRITEIVQTFSLLSLLWLTLILAVRVLELVINQYNHPVKSDFLTLLGRSWYSDFLFWTNYLLLFFLGFLCIGFLSLRAAKVSFKVLISIFMFTHVLLISYFNTSLVLLGGDLFNYSQADIIQTVGASGGVNLLSILVLSATLILTFFMVVVVPKKIKLNIYASLLVIFFSLAGIFAKNTNESGIRSDFAENFITNKSGHFYKSIYSYYNPEIYETDIYSDSYIGSYLDNYSEAIPFDYVDQENFPFLHNDPENDVLTPFFEPGQKKPDIVFILIEGLGRSFSNKGANRGSFTPFLDSLSTESMYWKNFMSNGGRTFAVLPSILGSLPFGENGFLAMDSKMPKHHSLINLLAHNGYRTSFYYGGDSDFDNMKGYLELNKIDAIHDLKSFPEGYKKLPAKDGFSWGYNDKEIFRNYLNTQPDDFTAKPKLSVLLTLTSHSPFVIDEKEKYSAIFEKRMEFLQFNEENKKLYRNFTDQYSTVLYADDAVKSFFQFYEKRKDFSNTIFIITGDHRIPEIPMSSKIDRYHVPLIIYSPLLKRTAEIASVSSHFDIAPTLLSFLKNNYNLKLPKLNSFMGQGLDTTRSFQNIHEIPLMQTKSSFIDFVMGEYHLNGEQLYQLNSDLGETRIIDKEKKGQMQKAFSEFKFKNKKLEEGEKLLPDSLITTYSQRTQN